ncbi:MAG: hypothetical protein R3C11_18130 [Planctomycetaceae bacterium]
MPENLSITSENGTLRREESRYPSHQDWILNVNGSVATFKLDYAANTDPSFKVPESDKLAQERLFSDELHRYKVKQESLSISSEIIFNVRAGSLDKLELQLSPGLEITSLRYGEIDDLFWEKVNQDENGALIRIFFPDQLKGSKHKIKLELISSLPANPGRNQNEGASFKLPKVSLLNNFILNRVWEVDINKPLQLQNHIPENLELVYINEGQLTTLKFQQLAQNCDLTINVGFPAVSVDIAQVCFLTREMSDWTLTAEIALSTINGTLFNYDFKIPEGWEIIDVRRRTRSSSQSNLSFQWSDNESFKSDSLLHLNFSDGIADGETEAVLIEARPRTSKTDNELVFPFFRSTRDRLNTLLAFTPSSLIVSYKDNSPGTNTREILRDDLPFDVLDFDLVNDDQSASDDLHIIQIMNTSEAAPFRVSTPEQPFQATVSATYQISESTINERVNIDIVPQGKPVSKVYLYKQGESASFRPQASELIELSPLPQSISKFPDWKLPLQRGELWEVAIEPPQSVPFQLSLFNNLTTNQFFKESLPLLFVPGASEFDASFSVINDSPETVQISSNNKNELQRVAASPAEKQPGQKPPTSEGVPYKHPLDKFFISSIDNKLTNKTSATCNLKLFTTIGVTEDPTQQYVAIYEIPQTVSKLNLALRWPEDVEVISTHLNETNLPLPAGQRRIEFALDQFTKPSNLTIRYQVRSQKTGFYTRIFDAKLPVISLKVNDFKWFINTPSNEHVTEVLNGDTLLHEAESSWFAYHLWGPLGRINPLRENEAETGLNPQHDQLFSSKHQSFYLHHLQVPDEITFRVMNSTKYYLLGFLIFFLSTLMTAVMNFVYPQRRNAICGATLIIAFTILVLSPGWLHLPLGAFFSGTLIGWLLSSLISHLSRILQQSKPKHDEIPLGSTRAYPTIQAIFFCLVTLGCTGTLFAQQASTEPVPNAVPDIQKIYEYNVFENPDDSLLYVPAKIYRPLLEEAKTRNLAVSTWLQKADYKVHISARDLVGITADFVFIAAEVGNHYECYLPLDPNISIDNCQIEGIDFDNLSKTESGFIFKIDRKQIPTAAERPLLTPDASASANQKSAATESNSTRRYIHVRLKFYPSTTN